MTSYIYNADSKIVTVIINGVSNEQIEAYAAKHYDLNDEFGMAYSDNELHVTSSTEVVTLN